ncbi:exosome complex protein [Chloropicon primus]|uniref:Exosome complex protein n=1 Tax=Chloropicon primus TaxID=1764295 RepID=A0A5B8MXY3_9CHLO|nr:exosome complex protein [Chloropicon primus]UPR04655.1 exosome complex protein [Chloropicon primus]|eukprot:QDZ25459.1 exosome complex protein [Chloropicon primus]
MASGSVGGVLGGDLRQDGRKWNELRRLTCDLDVVKGADGSAMFMMGRTKVLASCNVVPMSTSKLKRSGVTGNRGGGGGGSAPVVELRVSWAPFAMQERRERGRTDRFIVDLENALRCTVQTMLNSSSSTTTRTKSSSSFSAMGSTSEVQIKVVVLTADGGVKSCCVNAVTCAVGMANLACGNFVVSCGCTAQPIGKTLREARMLQAQGAGEGQKFLLDPNSTEINKHMELSLAVTVSGERHHHQDVVSVMCDSKMTPEDLEETVDISSEGCKAIGKFVRKTLMEYMSKVATVSLH